MTAPGAQCERPADQEWIQREALARSSVTPKEVPQTERKDS